MRNPYEDWVAHFSHARRKYPRPEIHQADELLKQTVEYRRAAQLGDPRWMAETMEKIASLAVRSRDMKAAIGEIVRGWIWWRRLAGPSGDPIPRPPEQV
ncbi:hypothetical protein ACIP98_01220 [Streptomyces sp. NPDC088354]|uniref:hypothetical protein n=1 Tax=Streptomyces sp. NPDC088354 TaxID=3365856 RepID=UPI0037F5E9C6